MNSALNRYLMTYSDEWYADRPDIEIKWRLPVPSCWYPKQVPHAVVAQRAQFVTNILSLGGFKDGLTREEKIAFRSCRIFNLEELLWLETVGEKWWLAELMMKLAKEIVFKVSKNQLVGTDYKTALRVSQARLDSLSLRLKTCSWGGYRLKRPQWSTLRQAVS